MAYPVLTGQAVRSGITVPEIWSTLLQQRYYPATILSYITNNDWEGEIRDKGDVVHIRKTPEVSVTDDDGRSDEYDELHTEIISLEIDKAKKSRWREDDVTRYQSDYSSAAAVMTNVVEKTREAVERELYDDVISDFDGQNFGPDAGEAGRYNLGSAAAPLTLSPTLTGNNTITTKILQAGAVLDEQNVPTDGRYIIIPPELQVQVKTSDLRRADLTGDRVSLLRIGERSNMIGMIDNFVVFTSNLLPKVGTDNNNIMLFGHRDAISFALQFVTFEGPLKDIRQTGNFYRTRFVYGYKVVKPEAAGYIVAKGS